MAQRGQNSVAYQQAERPSEIIVSGRRLDNRGYEEFRQAFLDVGTHSKAAGSAYAEFGNTKVLVGVFGPRQKDTRGYAEKGQVQCNIQRISFSTPARASSRQTDEDREGAAVLQQALEPALELSEYPNMVVDIFCVVMESAGSDLALLLTAASLALADAGIPMLDLVSCCQIARVKGEMLLDPTLDESYRQDGSCLLAMMPSSNKVTHISVMGEWNLSQLTSAVELGMGACLQLDASLRAKLKESIL